MYSIEDAKTRVLLARVSSLDEEEINPEYLNALRVSVQSWLDAIDAAYYDLKEK